jgi:hypothetical protein
MNLTCKVRPSLCGSRWNTSVHRLGQGSKKGAKEVFVANISSVRVVVPPKRVVEAPKAQKLYRTDPFTPSIYEKGKKHRIV